MSITEECELHEMIGCQVCHPRPKPPPEPDSRPFVARYDGQCPRCNLPIHAGRDRIILRETSAPYAGGAIHEGCA